MHRLVESTVLLVALAAGCVAADERSHRHGPHPADAAARVPAFRAAPDPLFGEGPLDGAAPAPAAPSHEGHEGHGGHEHHGGSAPEEK